MKNKYMIIDYGREQNDNYNSYDLWDEQKNIELKDIKISSNYELSTGDIIYIMDLENINNVILKIEKGKQ